MNKKQIKNRLRNIYLMLIVFTLFLIMSGIVQAEEKARVAVLPFIIHSPEPMDHLRQDLQKMLTDSIIKKGLSGLNPSEVNKHGKAFQSSFLAEDLLGIGRDLNADWIIQGSLTQVRRKISLDIKIIDIKTAMPPLFLYMVEDDLDRLSNVADQAATSIYNQITGVVQLDDIQIYGNRRIADDAILALIQSKKGEELDRGKLDKDLRSIFSMGFFTDIAIETEDGPSGKIVTFKVTEKPAINEISFKGNKKVKAKDLSVETGIKQYSILNQSEIKQSINRLKDYYRQKGFYNVEIKEIIEPKPRNEVALTYMIEEGKEVYIREIQFIGNEKFDDDDLKDIMETSEKGFLSWFTKSGLLDRKKLEFDMNKIISFYHNHGFIRAKTGEPEITHNKEEDGLIITVEIIEDHQYTVNSAKVSGDLIIPESDLMAYISIHREEYYNREVIRRDILNLKDAYGDDGYAYAEIIPVTSEDDENHFVNIDYNINKKNKVRFERINITGNSHTRDNVIRRELEVIEGDFYSGSKIRKSSENLYRLGYFQDMEIDTREGNQDDFMILDINLKEQNTGSLGFGVGYSSFDKAIASFQISENNLFGRGQKLSASASLGTKTSQYDISFTEPWLMGTRLSAGFDLYNSEIEFDDYTKNSTGGALSFGFPINFGEHLRGSIRYAYDTSDVKDIGAFAPDVIKDMAGENVKSSATFGLSRDSRDRPFFTSKGSLNTISYEYAGGFLGGDSGFNKYGARSSWYFPAAWNTVIMLQARAGYVKQRSDGKLPVYEKFTLGGLNSVRGYKYAAISPKDPVTGGKIGGDKMWVYNFEYHIPVAKDQGLLGVVFFDAGNVFAIEDDWEFKAKRSVGLGIRWYSPVGPLRVEYGHKLDAATGESKGGWDFSLGGTF